MLAKQIDSDYIQAMKARETLRAATLSFLRAQLKNVMIDKREEELKDEDVIVVIKKQVKQRQDSIEQYSQGGRDDLAQKEKSELEILKTYLPEEMSAEELKPIIDAAVKEAEAQGMKDMGKVMKGVVPKVAGRADNKMVSTLVKQALEQL